MKLITGIQKWEYRDIVDPNTGEKWNIDADVNFDTGEARVIKIRGNVNHPNAFTRALDVEIQAALLGAHAERESDEEDDEVWEDDDHDNENEQDDDESEDDED